MRSQSNKTLAPIFLGLILTVTLLITTAPITKADVVRTIVLNDADSYDFSTNTRGTLSGGDFYYSDSSGVGSFYANNVGQRGLQDLGDIGNVALHSVPIPTSGYTRYGANAVFYHTYVSLAQQGEEGSYIVFRVTSLMPDYSSVTIAAHYIPAVALTVSVAPASLSATVGQSVTFTATASGGTGPYAYQWYEGTNIMSGQTSAALTVSKSAAGSFSYHCHVTDLWDEWSSNTVTLTVVAPPTASVSPSSLTVTAGESATFTVSASGGTTPYSYQWYAGTSAMAGQTSTQLTVTKSAAGSFSYYCKVTDSGSRTANSNTASLTVNAPANVAPVASFVCSPSTQEVNKVVSFDASGSSDSDGTITSYAWSFGDGNTGSGATATHSYASAGAFTVKLTVTDNGGLTATKEVSVTVKPAGGSAGFPLEYVVAGVAVAVVAVVVVFVVLKFLRRPKKLPTPAQLRITADPTTLVADGETKATITMQLLDKAGNPMPALVDTQVRVNAAKGKVENPVVTILKGKDAERTVLVSSKEAGSVPVSAMAEGLKSITITLNFVERVRYCMHCGTQMPSGARACKNCGLLPPAGVDTKVCANCDSVIPIVAKFCGECGTGQKE